MSGFGETLRAAREAKGYTTSQLAATTRLLLQIVEDLEHDVFTRIPAPIYGRGFVKLYCEAVGLDPRPLVAQYMELQSKGDSPSAPQVAPPPQVPAAEVMKAPAMPQTEAGMKEKPHVPRRLDLPRMQLPPLPRHTWRIAVVAAAALLAAWALAAGIRAVYRATMTPPGEQPAGAGASEAVKPAAVQNAAPENNPGAEAAAPRKPADIPPLYID